MSQELQIPIMCTLSEAALQRRKTDLQQSLFAGVLASQPTENGYRLDFPAADDWLGKITKFIQVERECCSFLTFELTIPAQQNSMSLHICGTEGVKAFIEKELLG